MPHARLKIRPTGSLPEFSRDHPETEFRFLSSWPTEDGLRGITEVETPIPDTVLAYLDEAPELHAYDVLHQDEHLLVVESLISDPAPHRAALNSGTLPRFPLVVKDGWVINELTTTHDQLSEFKSELEATGIEYEVVSITATADPSNLLTGRQIQFITAALERGYYESPRRCSLTELADEFGVTKGTASGILHRAEETIIEEFMVDVSG